MSVQMQLVRIQEPSPGLWTCPLCQQPAPELVRLGGASTGGAFWWSWLCPTCIRAAAAALDECGG